MTGFHQFSEFWHQILSFKVSSTDVHIPSMICPLQSLIIIFHMWALSTTLLGSHNIDYRQIIGIFGRWSHILPTNKSEIWLRIIWSLCWLYIVNSLYFSIGLPSRESFSIFRAKGRYGMEGKIWNGGPKNRAIYSRKARWNGVCTPFLVTNIKKKDGAPSE